MELESFMDYFPLLHSLKSMTGYHHINLQSVINNNNDIIFFIFLFVTINKKDKINDIELHI